MNYQYQTSLIPDRSTAAYISERKLVFNDLTERALEVGSSGKEKWGEVFPMYVHDDNAFSMPSQIKLKWISVTEGLCYSLDEAVDVAFLEKCWNERHNGKDGIYDFLALGIAPYGKVAIWIRGYSKQRLIKWVAAKDISQIGEQLPYLYGLDLSEFCKVAIQNDEDTQRILKEEGLPDEHYFDRLMQQFTYRFVPLLRWWNEEAQEWWEYDEEMEGDEMPTLDFVEVKCHDGTFDRLRDGSLLNYHEAGKPSRVCVGWHVGKREYSAYFFFSHDELVPLFRTCYGAHPETKVDFLLQIDPENNKYEPALFRYGMKEPLAIGDDACQVLVFRNKFECYRSPNYSQPKGAWR